MTDVVIRQSKSLSGEVCAPPSKAYTHRMLIAGLLSEGTTEISTPLVSNDTQATVRAIKAFGATVVLQRDCWSVKGVAPLRTPEGTVDCGESGATLRFMIPVSALAPKSSIFTLGTSLEKRPLTPLLQSLKKLGVKSTFQRSEKGSSVKVQGGNIKGGKTSIRGDISSQFVSGLLFACPMARQDTEITVTTPLESKSYVQMTEEILEKHGAKVFVSKDFRQLRIPSGQKYSPYSHEVPGDFSSAAFLLAAAAITSSKIRVKNLNCRTAQGDKAIVDILEKMGAKVKAADAFVEVEGKQLNAVAIDARDIPDLVPVCAVLACYSKGTSRICNAKRLIHKESNRLLTLYVELKKMGADIAVDKDSLTIKGLCPMHGAVIDPHNDHRIAMACTVAALGASGETKIQNSECVEKSYPTFFEDLRSLGVEAVGGQFDR
ncbi:MAG TPA: 3-phosphoshikimate 1-carboxyvinyltransferase [Candidatus Bathyarchaeia archaeon]